MKRPALVLFDLGNVIVNVDHRAVAARFAETSEKTEFRDPAILLSTLTERSASLLRAFDTGQITPRAFYDHMRSAYGLILSFEDFVEIWNSGFSENHEVSNLVTRLTPHVRLFLLTNTNPLHFDYLQSTCPVIHKMEKVILSYQLGCMKPAAEIYKHALHTASLPPELVWYVDDVPEFVDAGAQLGIHAIQFRSASQLTTDFHGVLDGAA